MPDERVTAASLVPSELRTFSQARVARSIYEQYCRKSTESRRQETTPRSASCNAMSWKVLGVVEQGRKIGKC